MQKKLLAGRNEKLIKRSDAAELCGVIPRTLRRWEITGALVPVKLNSRLTCYRAADVARILAGEVETVSAPPSAGNVARTASGTFTASKAEVQS